MSPRPQARRLPLPLDAIRQLRLLLETGDTAQARGLALEIGLSLPEGPRRDHLTSELQYSLEHLELAAILNVANPSVERNHALEALEAIQRALAP